MGIFAIWSLPSQRNNFESFMLNMQYHEMMTDLKKMPQELSVALSKCKELSKENQMYWWVTTMVMTQLLGTECVCPFLSLKQSEGSGYIYGKPLKRNPASFKALPPLKLLYFPFQNSWDRKDLHNDGDINQPWASLGVKVDLYVWFTWDTKKDCGILGVLSSPKEDWLSNYRWFLTPWTH